MALSGLAGMVRVGLATAVVSVLAMAMPAQAGGDSERWYVLKLSGERAGWMMERESETESGRVLTESEMTFKIGRLGSEVELTTKSGVLETPEGELVEIRAEQKMGLGTVRTRYLFEGDQVVVKTTQLGRTTEKTEALPSGDWLTPREAAAFEAARIEEGAEEFSYSVIDVSQGLKVVSMSYKVVGPTTVQAMGKSAPAIEWIVINSLMPGIEAREFVNWRGEAIMTTVEMGGISMSILASDEAFAKSPFDAPELMLGTLVRPDREIDRPRLTTRAVYVLESEGGELPELPNGGAQRVETLGDGQVRVTVNVREPVQATAEEIADERYLAPSVTADSDDPDIMALVVQATKGVDQEDPVARARAIERFVVGYIDAKTLGVGFATASEVCQTKQGDCSEHAVLIAAMLRADGIPSRGVSGLVYVDQFVSERKVFGYHMWAQALIEVDGTPRWIDLDAAVHPMDATHIAVATSSLADDDVINSMIGLVDMLGTLRIVVEEYE